MKSLAVTLIPALALASTLEAASRPLQSSTLQSSTLESSYGGPERLKAERLPSAVRHAGTYHVSTGAWTRTGGQVSNFGPDTIYVNTATSGYFSSAGSVGGFAPGSTNFDNGSIPTSMNTNFPVADRDAYSVNCIELGYCDLGVAGSSGWEVSFYADYTPCTFNGQPDATVLATGLPAGGCWTVALDLSGGLEFCLAGDGGDGFDNVADLDAFGWSFTYAGTDGTQPAGFLLAGDPAATDPNWVVGGLPMDGSGYYRTVPPGCSQENTGLQTRDFWWIEDPTGVNSNCFFFGYSNPAPCTGPFQPYASWYLELQADVSPCIPTLFDPYCQSNPTSTGVNSTISLTGSTSAAADNVTLTATVPANVFGFFITSRMQGFVANPAGSQGNLCLGGGIGRFVGPGQIMHSGASGTITLDTNTGVWSLSAIPTPSGPYQAAPGITTNFQLWHRDSGGVATSNFTDGYSVTWTL